MIYIPYPRVNCLKTIPFTAAHTYRVHIWQYRPPGVTSNNVASVCGGLTTNDLQLINYIKLLSTCLSSSLSGYFFSCVFFSARCHKCREFGHVRAQCPKQTGGRMEVVPEQNQHRRNREATEKGNLIVNNFFFTMPH